MEKAAGALLGSLTLDIIFFLFLQPHGPWYTKWLVLSTLGVKSMHICGAIPEKGSHTYNEVVVIDCSPSRATPLPVPTAHAQSIAAEGAVPAH